MTSYNVAVRTQTKVTIASEYKPEFFRTRLFYAPEMETALPWDFPVLTTVALCMVSQCSPVGKNDAKTVGIILQAARSSVGTTSPAGKAALKQKAEVLIHMDGYPKELTALIIDLCRSGMGNGIEI